MLNSTKLMRKALFATMFAGLAFGSGAQATEVGASVLHTAGEAGYVFLDSPSKLSRATVRAALHAAIASGELNAGIGERGPVPDNQASTRSRAEVLAEMREAARLGLAGGGEAGPRQATAAEEAMIVAAGKAAAEKVMAARRAAPGG